MFQKKEPLFQNSKTTKPSSSFVVMNMHGIFGYLIYHCLNKAKSVTCYLETKQAFETAMLYVLRYDDSMTVSWELKHGTKPISKYKLPKCVDDALIICLHVYSF